jgi:hypothetical protein
MDRNYHIYICYAAIIQGSASSAIWVDCGQFCTRREQDSMTAKTLYRIVFMSQGQVYEIYARNVGHGSLFGFVEVEKMVFGERSSVVVDPSEEKIKSEFAGVKRTYLPMHSIIRIDEVDKQGKSKISKLEGGNVAQFPIPVYTPGGTNKP